VKRPDRIVAVGLLSQRDLDALGSGFKRAYPITDTNAFSDLLSAIDDAEAAISGQTETDEHPEQLEDRLG
jgi:hypothetical protein